MAVGTNGPPVVNGYPYTYPEQTLGQLRDRLLLRLGYGAMLATPPPGVTETLNDFLQDAHEQLYFRYPTLRQQLWWTVTTQAGSRFYDVPFTGAQLGGTDISIVNGTPDSIASVGQDFTAAGFTAGMVVNVTGTASNDGLHTLGTVGTTSTNLATTTTVTAESAGNQVFVLEAGAANLDLREITYVGMLDGTIWNEMISGIPPALFNIDQQQRPTNYEIREFIEVYPEPDQAYVIYLKGRMALRPFTADTDVTTVDGSVVFLHALAAAKAHFGQGDAQVYFQQLEAMLGNLNETTFGNNRYIPEPDPPLQNLAYPQMNPPRP